MKSAHFPLFGLFLAVCALCAAWLPAQEAAKPDSGGGGFVAPTITLPGMEAPPEEKPAVPPNDASAAPPAPAKPVSRVRKMLREHITWSVNFPSFVIVPQANGRTVGGPTQVDFSFGAAVAWNFKIPLSVELSLDINPPLMTAWGYSFDLKRAMPIEWENRSAEVLGFVIGIQAVGRFSLPKHLTLRAYGGPSFDLRAVFLASDLTDTDFTGDDNDPKLQTRAIKDYFWSKARWFLPVVGVGLDYDLFTRIRVGLDFRTWFPIYRIWSGDDAPGIDGFRFGILARITVLPKK
jgi:hypothetical protein